jgi:hypothetical protein
MVPEGGRFNFEGAAEELGPSDIETGLAAAGGDNNQAEYVASKWMGKRSGVSFAGTNKSALPSINPASLVALDSSDCDSYDLFPPADLGVDSGRLAVLAEALHISRPLLHVVLNKYMKKSRWVALLLALAMECVSIYLAKKYNPLSANPELTFPGSSLASVGRTTLVQKELARRNKLLFLYLLRDPVFSQVLHPAMVKIGDTLSVIPGVGSSVTFVAGMLSYYSKHWTLTSGS